MKRISLSVIIGVVLAGAATVGLASRNSSGSYTVSASGTYPFVTGTSISSTTMTSIFSDLSTEMTDSLSRSGKGSMSAPLRVPDGVVGTPTLSFANEPATGLYRVGASNPALSVAGTQRQSWTTTGSSINGTLTVSGKLDRPSLPTIGQQTSTSTGAFSTSSATFVDVMNMTVTITTTGRPVVLSVQPDGTANAAGFNEQGSATTLTLQILRGATPIAVSTAVSMFGPTALTLTPSWVVLDAPVAGTYTYKVQAKTGGTGGVLYSVLTAYEL